MALPHSDPDAAFLMMMFVMPVAYNAGQCRRLIFNDGNSKLGNG